jgi:hypothetical protein
MSERLPNAFARFVAARSDVGLTRLMEGRARRALVRAVIRGAPRRLNREACLGEPVVVEIRVRGSGRRRQDSWFLLIGNGRCIASPRPLGEPETTIIFEPAAFLRYAAGQASPRELFMAGRLSVDGSLILATALPAMFRMPARVSAGVEPPTPD